MRAVKIALIIIHFLPPGASWRSYFSQNKIPSSSVKNDKWHFWYLSFLNIGTKIKANSVQYMIFPNLEKKITILFFIISLRVDSCQIFSSISMFFFWSVKIDSWFFLTLSHSLLSRRNCRKLSKMCQIMTAVTQILTYTFFCFIEKDETDFQFFSFYIEKREKNTGFFHVPVLR